MSALVRLANPEYMEIPEFASGAYAMRQSSIDGTGKSLFCRRKLVPAI
jgi:hypothetical protein